MKKSIFNGDYSAADIIDLEETNITFRTEVNSVLRLYMIQSMSDCGVRLEDVLSQISGVISPDSFPNILVDVNEEYIQLKYNWFKKTYQYISNIIRDASLPF